MLKRIVSAVSALMLCMTVVSASGCSDAGSSSSESMAEDSSSAESTQESSAADTGSKAAYAPSKAVGEKLKAVYDLYSKGHYTIECELTGTNIPDKITVLRVVDGSDSYQLQKEKLGNHGTVTLSGKSYDFDFVCGMYRENPSPKPLNVIEQIVRDGVPKTNPNTGNKDPKYDIEQYTYTGDTYITVMDFFFDKKDSRLVRYDMTYSVEGSDDTVETRTVTRLDGEVDDSVFNAYFTDTLVNFDTMSEQQRLGFCQGLCASWGVTADEMYEYGVTMNDLGTVDYDTLFGLIHTYGKRHDPDTGSLDGDDSDSSAADESSISDADGSLSEADSSLTPDSSLPETDSSDTDESSSGSSRSEEDSSAAPPEA